MQTHWVKACFVAVAAIAVNASSGAAIRLDNEPIATVTLHSLRDLPTEYANRRVRVQAVIVGPSVESEFVLVDSIPSTVGIPGNVDPGDLSKPADSLEQRFRAMTRELWGRRDRAPRREIEAVVVGRVRLEHGGPRFRCGNETAEERKRYDEQARTLHAVLDVERFERVLYYDVRALPNR